MSDEFEYKEIAGKACKPYVSKQYTWWDYVTSIVEFAWVQTYHRYYNTLKFKQWEYAQCLLSEFRKNQKLAARLTPRTE